MECNPAAQTTANDLMITTGVDIIVTDGGITGDVSCPDMGIFRIDDPVPLQYNVFFSGWNRRDWDNLPGDRVITGIHHPDGDVKKISEGNYEEDDPCLVVDWDQGITEGGSSGSPGYISTHEVIGVLSHGPTNINCSTDPFEEKYSWLNISWGDLQPHLAPGNGEAQTHGGIDPISACISDIELNRRFFPGHDWQKRNQITIQAEYTIEVANITETSIESSPIGYFTTPHAADYIIRAGDHITIYPGFRINRPAKIGNTYYPGVFPEGHLNKVSFQIDACTPFIDDCGFNHESAVINVGEQTNQSENEGTERWIKSPLLQVVPNPTTGILTVTFSETFRYTLTDIMGKTVMQGQKAASDNLTLDISALQPGIYYISVMNGEAMQVTKVIKQ